MWNDVCFKLFKLNAQGAAPYCRSRFADGGLDADVAGGENKNVHKIYDIIIPDSVYAS